MALKDLFFSIFAKDKTGDAFSSVNQRLRQTEGAAASLSDRVGRVGQSMQRMGAMGSIASAGVIAAFRGSLDLYDEQARAETKVAQAIRATGGAAGFTAAELKQVASDLQSVSRFGDEAILNGVTAQLLTFKNIAGDTFLTAQKAALDLATVLDRDLMGTSIMLGKALNDPARGVAALAKAGVTFSDEQKQIIKDMQAMGDIAGAQKLILDEIASAYGGQAEAARQTGAGIRDAWVNTWGDIKEVVGGVLAQMLPIILDPLQRIAAAFQAMTPEGQKAAVMFGALAVALPPLIGALGLVVSGLAALSGPIGLAVAGIAALAGAVAYFWPESDKAAKATDTLVLALGDEITQSQLLQQALNSGVAMSVATAEQKLKEAQARHENVKAIIAEQRALALQSDAYGGVMKDIADAQAQLSAIGFPANDKVLPERADAFEAVQLRLVELRKEQARLLETDGEMSDQLERTEENIKTLEEALANAKGGMVNFGNSMVTPISLGDRLSKSLGSGGGATDAVKELTTESEKLADSEFWGTIKSNFRDLITGATSWGDAWKNILGDAIDRIFDLAFTPAWDGLFANLSKAFSGTGTGTAGGTSGGGGIFGGLVSGIGGLLGGLLGFDTGGAFTVRGRAGSDRNVAAVRLSEGENVEVTRRGEAKSAAQVNVYIQTPDPQAFAASKAQIGAQIGRAVAAGQRAA